MTFATDVDKFCVVEEKYIGKDSCYQYEKEIIMKKQTALLLSTLVVMTAVSMQPANAFSFFHKKAAPAVVAPIKVEVAPVVAPVVAPAVKTTPAVAKAAVKSAVKPVANKTVAKTVAKAPVKAVAKVAPKAPVKK